MPDRSGYQHLPKTADDAPDLDPEVFSTPLAQLDLVRKAFGA